MTHSNSNFIWRNVAILLLIVTGVVLGMLLWRLRPDEALTWLTGMLTLPVCWGLLTVFGALGQDQSVDRRVGLYNALMTAGVIVVGALLSVSMTTLEWLPNDWSDRYGMLISALVLVVIGNGLPKKVEPGCSRNHGQTLQRLFGWTFVAGGLLLTAVWLSPLATEIARTISFVVYGLMFLACLMGSLHIMRR